MRARQWPLYLMLLPSLVFLAVFIYAPMYGLTLAFKSFKISEGFNSPWAAPVWANFWWLADSEFWNVFMNTVKIAGLKFATGFPTPIILALLINEVRQRKFKRVVQTVLYLPHFISWVIFAGIMYRLLGTEGPLSVLGNPLASEGGFLWVLVITNLVKESGWATILFLAAITGVSAELYDAAYVDGCSRLQTTRYVTLPGIMPVILVMLILSIPGVLSAGFDQIWNLANAMVVRSSNVLDIYILRVGIQGGQFSYGIALGFVVNVLAFGLVMLTNHLSKQRTGWGLW